MSGSSARFRMRPGGFEPPAHSLEGCCSIQLSYGRLSLTVLRCERAANIDARILPHRRDHRLLSRNIPCRSSGGRSSGPHIPEISPLLDHSPSNLVLV